ncbi:MAG: DUF1345 domain-containing protein [Sphingomonadales bacterium]|nr:DUF1345 domain-containing protein [Sphingomonadales bacterium]MBD3774007.1 DUF1345 domain-containing protein [Paracoccaceae bacterium]
MRVPHARYVLFLGVLAAALPLALMLAPLKDAALMAFDAGVLAFILSCIPLWRHGDPARLRRDAQRNDAGGFLLLALSALISAIAIGAVTLLVYDKQKMDVAAVALMVATLVASWLFANLVYTFHYARLFYGDLPDSGGKKHRGGLDFPGGEDPGFSDFVNFAFVIGMTCQTADIEITGKHIRRVSTFHAMFAFVFNLGILALTVNTLASG